MPDKIGANVTLSLPLTRNRKRLARRPADYEVRAIELRSTKQLSTRCNVKVRDEASASPVCVVVVVRVNGPRIELKPGRDVEPGVEESCRKPATTGEQLDSLGRTLRHCFGTLVARIIAI